MSNPDHTELSGSTAAVALALTKYIAGREEAAQRATLDRTTILRLYAQCHRAASGVAFADLSLD